MDRCYRYSGNGHLIWKPTLAQLIGAPGVTAENIVLDEKAGLIRPAAPGTLATLVVPIRSSYALVWADITGTWLRGSADDVNRITVLETVKGKARWREAWSNEKTGEVTATCSYGKRINRRYDYKLRIELMAKSDVTTVGLKAITFDHTFTNNWLALPFLKPGKNTIRVRLDNPDLLKRVKLLVKYEWEEGEGWAEKRSDAREVTSSPFVYTLDAKGPKFPRMKALTLEAVDK